MHVRTKAVKVEKPPWKTAQPIDTSASCALSEKQDDEFIVIRNSFAVQGPAKRWSPARLINTMSPGCVNAAGKAR